MSDVCPPGPRAACIKCGALRADFRETCPSCGHRPDGDGLLVAWLLSSHHLTHEQLEEAQQRIMTGEPVRPSARMIASARAALGKAFSTDPGLPRNQVLGLMAVSILLTPLVGWMLSFWWRNNRPRAAWQAFLVSAPASVLFTFGVIGLRVWR